MKKQHLKSQLNQFIDTIDDEETLIVLNKSFNSIKSEFDILDELSPAQKTHSLSSLQQAKDGNIVKNELVKNNIQVRLTKSFY